jgi:hypothetical protein
MSRETFWKNYLNKKFRKCLMLILVKNVVRIPGEKKKVAEILMMTESILLEHVSE